MKPIGLLSILVGCLALAACGDSDDSGDGADAGDQGSDGGPVDTDGAVPAEDAGKDAATNPGTDSGTDASTEDSGMDGDAGSVSFTVPSAGGSFEVAAGSVMLSFKFPASAAGQDITLTPTDPNDVTFPDPSLASAFGMVIDMQPDGATFADPIEVTFSDGSFIAFDLKNGVLTPLPLAADGKSVLVSHFSSLAVPLTADLCESASPWTDYAAHQLCSTHAPATSMRNFGCKNYRYCYVLSATCCVDPSVSSNPDDGCQLGDPGLTLAFLRTDSNGGAYPYCDTGLPTSTSVVPNSVPYDGTDKTVTLYGTNFVPNGAALLGQLVLATTFVSSTEVTAVIPAGSLNGVASVGVRYAIPSWNATGACTNAASSNCDYGTASVAQTVAVSGGSGGGSTPTVTSIVSTLLANGLDQQITLNGTNFDQNGSVYQNLDSAITTSWQSATLAYATVPGTLLQSPGTLQDVGYVNPTSNATGACTAAAPSNCDWVNRSNYSDLTIDAVVSSCLSGGTQIASVGSGTCAAPAVLDMRNSYSGDIRLHYIGAAAGADEATEPASTTCGIASTARDFVYQVLLPAGADLDMSVDAAGGANPVLFVHEDSACSQPINVCADDAGVGGCEFVSATHGSGAISGQAPYVTLSEATNSGVAFYTRFKVTGTITTPTLISLSPNSATAGSGTTITATLQGGSGWTAQAEISAGGGGAFEEFASCTVATDNTCTFSLPNALSAGSHDVKIQFTGRTGMPYATGTQTLTVN